VPDAGKITRWRNDELSHFVSFICIDKGPIIFKLYTYRLIGERAYHFRVVYISTNRTKRLSFSSCILIDLSEKAVRQWTDWLLVQTCETKLNCACFRRRSLDLLVIKQVSWTRPGHIVWFLSLHTGSQTVHFMWDLKFLWRWGWWCSS
jgi:hypothetical protein